MADPNPFKTTSEEFQELVPDFDPDPEKIPESFMKIITAIRRELTKLNDMKDDSGKKESPTSLARKELSKKYYDQAREELFDGFDRVTVDSEGNVVESWTLTPIQDIFDWQSENLQGSVALAELLREVADHFQFVGDLHTQDLRNKKFAGSADTDDDAVAQREIVSRLIDNAKLLPPVAAMLGYPVDESVEIPTLKGNQVGTSGTGERKSSKYPVFIHRMKFTIDDEEIPTKTSFSHAVLNYLFPRMGIHAYTLDVEDVIAEFKEKNSDWDRPNNTTEAVFQDREGNPITFKVEVLKVS